MIEVEGLTRYFGSFAAVRDVSFSVGEHAIVGLLGLNGAGKSTILKMLGGLLLPSAGTIRIDGDDVTELPDATRRRFGVVPEEPPLYRDMRVEDFLRWAGELKGVPRRELSSRTAEVVKQCDLVEMQGRLIRNLSHGYRKRVGIAQAIIHEPRLVILDEPISGLDPVQIVEMRQILRRLRETSTVLISSHILSEISQTCDRLLVIHQGQLVASGTEEELFAGVQAAAGVLITVRGTEAALAEFLEAAAFVSGFEITGRPGGDFVQAQVALEGDEREALVAALVAAGFGVRRLEESEAELEQVFLGLTRQQQRTSGAGANDAAPGADGTIEEGVAS